MTELRRVKAWYGWTMEPVNKPEPVELPPPGSQPTPVRKPRPVQPAVHGTRRRYAKGCRCDECSRRESEYRAAWRLATGRTTTSRVLGGPS